MSNIYTINPNQESILLSRISELKKTVQLGMDESRGFRYRDNSYILFKIKQKWIADGGNTAQEFLNSLSPEQIDKYIVWGIKDAAASDSWYGEKAERDAVEVESSIKNRIILASREIEIFIQKANELLDKMLIEVENAKSGKVLFDAMNTLQALGQSIRELQSRPEFRHVIPDELEEKIDKINTILTHKSLGDDLNEWYDLLRSGIEEFISAFNVDIMNQELKENLTDKLEIRKHIMRYTRAIQKTISDYENKFGSDFDPSLKKAFDDKKKELSKAFGLYLEEEKPSMGTVDINTIDPDKLLDLYEEIKAMPNGEEKLEKIREFEKMNRIYKSSYTNVKLSSRE